MRVILLYAVMPYALLTVVSVPKRMFMLSVVMISADWSMCLSIAAMTDTELRSTMTGSKLDLMPTSQAMVVRGTMLTNQAMMVQTVLCQQRKTIIMMIAYDH